jgi:hypothetical protein
MPKSNSAHTLKNSLNKVTKIHFIFAGLLAAQVVIYDASKLITPEIVLKRWQIIAGFLAITTAVWYLAKARLDHKVGYTALTGILILTDILLASIFVYDTRGMASRAVLLFTVAIATAAILKNKAALFATAALCVAAYTTSAITYFVVNFNEGYKVELYGEIGFYSAMFFVLAGLIWAVSKQS